MNTKKKFIYIYIIFALVVALLSPMGVCYNAKAESVKGYVLGTALRMRATPDINGEVMKDGNGNVIYLGANHEVDILDTSTPGWYKVTTSYAGASYTGYVSSDYVWTQPAGGTGEAVDPNSDFEGYMNSQGFPDSYKPYLRQLHAIHPQWIFRAKHTGINWNTLVSNEINRAGFAVKNTVQCTSAYPHYGWRSTSVNYSFINDKWTPADGSNWYAASDALVTYYLDPRTYFYENYIFVFESLSFQDGVQTEEGVEAILAGTFMSHAVPRDESETYAQIIVRAGRESGVSPYFIAARIKQEMGSTAGVAASGNHGTYPNIYNFYNIGANDGGDAVSKGLKWAATAGSYDRPWNSPSKSIIGGAKYIGASYITPGQNTLYTQKFNVTNRTGGIYSHQYMTNVQAPSTECLSNYSAYRNNGLLDSAIVFEIPVYSNLPAEATVKPSDQGSPNNWLKSLEVSGYSLTPNFSVNYVTEYSVSVSENISSVSVSASPINGESRVSGTGTYNLNMGTNILQINVTAGNGAVRTYTLKIIRGDAGAGNTTLGTGPVAVGSKGDLNGDGKISVLDIVRIQRILVGLDQIDASQQSLCDLNGDGKISILDVVRLQRHIVGIESL